LRKKAKRVGSIGTQNPNIWYASYWPGKDFVPNRVNTPITLFKIPRQPFYYVRDPLMGWASRTTSTVEVEHIQAKHLLMLRKPWVRNLAHALSARLRRARNGQDTTLRNESTASEASPTRPSAYHLDSPGSVC
jgi:hypothetical protein